MARQEGAGVDRELASLDFLFVAGIHLYLLLQVADVDVTQVSVMGTCGVSWPSRHSCLRSALHLRLPVLVFCHHSLFQALDFGCLLVGLVL